MVTPKMGFKAIIDGIHREISEMREDRMLKDYPTDSERIKATDIPPDAREFFLEMTTDYIRQMREVREGDGETFDPKEELEITFDKGMLDGRPVYWMGIHDPQSPVNPSGHDYYVREDGEFVGWTES